MKWKTLILAVVIIVMQTACNLPTADQATTTPQQALNPQPLPPEVTPTETNAPEPQPAPTETLAEPTATQENQATAEACTPDSEFVSDVSIPDGTLVKAGKTITKTWRIRNTGTCTWTSSYVWEQINLNETKLTAKKPQMALDKEVAPGQMIDISVEVTLAADAKPTSKQIARFQMRDPQGQRFGTKPFILIFTGDGTGVCPVGDANQMTFINLTDRFCFLYPKDYEAYVGSMGGTVTRHPATPGVIEEILASVSISNEGSTGGLSTDPWADQMINDWKAPGTTPDVSNIQVGGLNARQTDELPGMVGNRIAFLVHEGNGFVFTIMPVDDSFPQKKSDALDLWDMVRTSFTFFSP